jgi:HlyD family secretion protein
MASGKKKIIIIITLVVVIIAAAAAGVLLAGNTASGTSSDEEQILTVEVKNGSVSVIVEGPSMVEPYRSQDVRARTSGEILTAPVEGDTFSQGDILIRFDDGDQRNAVRQAEINLAQAKIDLERADIALTKAEDDLAEKQRLLKSGAASKAQVSAAEGAVSNADLSMKSARLKVDQAVLSLEKAGSEYGGTVITAPFNGVVLKSFVSTGDIMNSGSLLLTYVDLAKVRLRAEVDEFDIGKIEPGMSVTITSDTLGDEKLKSKVERISPSAEVINNISIFTVSTVLNNSDGVLRPGMSADFSILISSDKGIVVPTKAVSTVRGRSYVKVYENMEVVTKRITIGADDGINTAVLEGLEEGEIIVLPSTAVFNFSATESSTGTSIVPITVPGTGGGSK